MKDDTDVLQLINLMRFMIPKKIHDHRNKVGPRKKIEFWYHWKGNFL